MATLVFSTVGTILGGPVGGAIGALVGQSIDQQIFGPPGPKVGDLKVQSSDYGAPIPRLYGTMRVAGTVVWATDLVPSEQTSGAKGQSTPTTSYAVSFAVALSSRPAGAVGRIWADGKLLRGADGDFKVATTFRFHDGSEDQAIDPLIGSVEGIDATPAYRGTALAVFEDLELAEYGNRIPFLTFELIADPAPPTIGAIVDDASRGVIANTAPAAVIGYAAYGASIRAAVSPLIEAEALALFDDGERVREASLPPSTVADRDLGCSADADAAARIEREMAPARSLPAATRLSYYDPARDFQTSEARASAGDTGGPEERRELAAALDAGRAKALAHRLIARSWAEREKIVLRLPPRFLGIEPGSRINCSAIEPSDWRVASVSIEGMAVRIELKPWWSPLPVLPADPGRALPSADLAAGTVALALIEPPADPAGGEASIMLAASSASPGWRPAMARVSVSSREYALALPRQKTVMGATEDALAPGQAYVRDDRSAVVVALTDEQHWLESCDLDALTGGANLAMIGEEAVQFGQAEYLAPGRFRLSRLLRGRGGSEWAMDGHQAGDRFVLLDRARLAALPLATGTGGATLCAAVSGPLGGVVTRTVTGEGGRPLSAAHPKAALMTDGGLAVTWVRRSRRGFAWIDGVDAQPDDGDQGFRVKIEGSGPTLSLECAETNVIVAPAQLAAVGAGSALVSIQQIGASGLSRPASIAIVLP